MKEQGTLEGLHRARKNMRRTRWVLVALGALLAVVLMLSGAVIIGAIIGVMAVVRAVLILQWQRQAPWPRGPYRGQVPSR
jgi:CHAD domain-containing protein